MAMKRDLLILCVFVPISLLAQSPFMNLDFESATVPYITNYDGWVSASAAFPGWTVWETNSIRDMVPYNLYPDGAQVALFAAGLDPIQALGDRFMAHFSGWPSSEASLSQIGTIPADAQTLQFDTAGAWFPGQTQSASGDIRFPSFWLALPRLCARPSWLGFPSLRAPRGNCVSLFALCRTEETGSGGTSELMIFCSSRFRSRACGRCWAWADWRWRHSV